MIDYKKLYYILFNSITDAINEMEALNIDNAFIILKKAQTDSESAFIECEE